MADQGGFQEQVKRLSELVTQFEQLPESPQKAKGKELMQLLMEVHAQGLERILDVAFESKQGGNPLIDRIGKDEVAGALLLLYSLHPDALETRVNTALERLRPRLRKLACTIDLESLEDGAAKVRITKSGHSCGSSTGELRSLVENGIYELAPDIASLQVLGLEEPSATGFVALESLMTPALASSVADGRGHRTGNPS